MAAAIILVVFAFLIIICTPKAAVSAPMPGITGGTYRNTGSTASPTWVEATSVLSTTGFSDDWDFAEAGKRTTRAKLYDKTRAELGGTLHVLADPAAADYVAFFAASQGNTAVDLMVLNGKVTVEGAIGVRAAFKMKRTESQDPDGIIYNDFECKPYMGGATPVTPSTVIMGATSTAGFTTI
jgi:hypothetical protein